MSTGTDIVKISRMEGLIKNGIPKKVFSEYEQNYINSKSNRLQTSAGIYAAKEAVLKALGTGITLPLNEVCINHLSDGKPFVVLTGTALEYANRFGIDSIDISISHDGEYAIACAYMSADKYSAYRRRALNKFTSAPSNAIFPDLAARLITKREPTTHKGSYGRLYVLAGSIGLTGAAVMACNSALKCGAGLITLGCARELNSIFECMLTEVMTKPLASRNGVISSQDINTVINDTKGADMCLIGPGLGRSEDVRTIVRAVLENSDTPCVIDADGLNAISKDIAILKERKSELILTPHIGEFSALTGLNKDEILNNPQKHATEFALKHNVVLVLKSHKTLVCTPDGNCYVNILGNPGMATGGTGDVLSGCIASFAAQHITLSDAALLGVYIHSLAGDMASYEVGEYSLTPRDIIDFLPHAIKL